MASQNKKISQKKHSHTPSTDQSIIIKIFGMLLLIVNLFIFYPILAPLLFRSTETSITGLVLYSALAVTPLGVINIVSLSLYLLLSRPKGIKMVLAWLGILIFTIYLLQLLK